MQHILRAGLVAAALSCNPADPLPPGDAPMKLEALDASCTEVWLSVAMLDGLQPRAVVLRRDTQVVFSGTVLSSDTTILDEGPIGLGLLPNRSYTYTLTRPTRYYTDQAKVTATTMDTTSHSFTWETTLLGDGSSTLYDVAIINDTLAYAVGEMYLRDSSGQIDPIRFNAALWNGRTWSIQRIPYFYQGQPFYHPIQTVFAFSANDVWFAGNGVIHWNGQAYMPIDISSVWGPNRINKIWGSSSSSLYIVGDGGSIAHHSGSTWRRLESGTTVDLKDVWGSSDGAVVFACGYRGDYALSVLLEQVASNWRRVVELPITLPPRPDSLSGSIASAWMTSPYNVQVATSGGMYRIQPGSHGEGKRTWYPDVSQVGFFNRVRGNKQNDIMVVGAFGTVAHFNGQSWKLFPEHMASGRQFFSVSHTGSQVVICGYHGGQAILLHGRR